MRLTGALLLAALLALPAAAADEFAFKDTRGQVQRLSDYRGKWVLVNFWATWCPPCLDEIPDLIALHNAHKDKDLVVLGIALEYASAKGVIDFAAKHALTYPVILGDQKMATQLGHGGALPTTILFDPSGKAAGYQDGAVTRAMVEEYIQSKDRK
jgi:thiol-disulfide isomerase/thioredoxin